MKKKVFRIFVIISIILCIVGLFLSYSALSVNVRHSISRGFRAVCNFSKLFDCDAEATSRYTTLFNLPIAYFFAIIYAFGIIAFLAWFFVGDERKNLVISGFLFFNFLTSVISLFVLFTLIVLEGIIGVFYPSMILINIAFTLFYYFTNKDFLKKNIFDKTGFKEYKSKINFAQLSIVGVLVVLFMAGVNYIGYKATDYKLQLDVSGGSRRRLSEEEMARVLVKKFEKTKKIQIDTQGLPYFGSSNPNAIKIVKITSSTCGYCKMLAKDIENYIKENSDKIRVYVVPAAFTQKFCTENNLSPGCLSLFGAYIAKKKGKFHPYYKKLFIGGGRTKSQLYAALAAAGVTPVEFNKVIKDPEARKWVKKLLLITKKLKVRGTPVFFINGRRVDGYVSPKVFKLLIEKAADLAG